MNKITQERYKQISNIWAMMVAASLAAAFFENAGWWGFLVATHSFIMCMVFIKKLIATEDNYNE